VSTRLGDAHGAGSTFANPVIAGFHPDPSVCRVGADYYLACSSFEYFPGVPVFHSRDLVHWTQVGNALDRPGQLPLDGAPSSGGVYAPTLRHHDGKFWLVTWNASHGGTVLFTADDPAGPWSDPVRVPGAAGFDPDLAWDEEGRCWCTYAGIEQVRIDPVTGQSLGEPRRLWSGTPGARFPEAPHLYRIGGYWYLLIAEGGTERGHCVSVARGPEPWGPFEPCPANPIVSHRSTSHAIQNTGHADLVEAPDGSWWMVLLGTRPRGGTPGWHVLGRETFLVPVTWADGWPVAGEVEPVMAAPVTTAPVRAAPAMFPPAMTAPGRPSHPVAASEERDDFDEPRLHPRWVSLRSRPDQCWSTQERPGWLTLHARDGSLDDSDVTFVGRRQQHLSCRVRVLADASNGRGGVTVRLDEHHHYEIEAAGGAGGADAEISALARIGPLRQVMATQAVPGGPVVLRIDVITTKPGLEHPLKEPDMVHLGIEALDGTVTMLAELDGRYLSTEVAGGFTGRVIGMYATSGTVAFDWYDYEPIDWPLSLHLAQLPPQ
jgi:xylan 1,4-beta-xylosidase